MLIGLYRQNPVTHICKQVKVYEQVKVKQYELHIQPIKFKINILNTI